MRPEDVGLGNFGRQRVPGLRREEPAMLARISAAAPRLETSRHSRKLLVSKRSPGYAAAAPLNADRYADYWLEKHPS